MSQIKITPQELRDASTFLGQKKEAIASEVSGLKGKIDEVSANWEGAAQSSFISTFESDMYPILHDTLPEVIQGIMEQLKAAADTLEEADAQIAAALRG